MTSDLRLSEAGASIHSGDLVSVFRSSPYFSFSSSADDGPWGQIYEVLKPEMVFEFTRARGRATSLVVRNEQDQVQATATRTP
jgi:hypothetical protein